MITEQAIVTQCEANRVEVQLQRASTCSHCDLAQGCGTGALGRMLGRRGRPLSLVTDQKVHPGDHLVLGISEAALVKSSLVTYLIPLIFMVIVSLFGTQAGLSEGWVILLAGLSFWLGMKLSHRILHYLGVEFLTPEIIYIHVNPQAGCRS
ncbi:MAG: SoxR reducing system RseC family protein [Pseudomonadota bacterium]